MSTNKDNKKIVVNMVSESDISVQGHGVHTAYDEIASALEKRDDVELIRGGFDEKVDCDIVHIHTIGTKALKKIRQKNVKKVVSAHIVPDSLIGSLVMAQYWYPVASAYMKYFYKKADKVLAVSNGVKNVLVDEMKIPSENVKIFYNNIDMSRYKTTEKDKKRARKELGFGENEFIVVGVGQAQPRKRVDVFVDMAKDNSDIKFIWIGGIPFKKLGADRRAMESLLESSTDNMKFPGIVDHDKVKKYLQAADVFCLPAEQENHPMCVLEAAGANLPIVLRDIEEYSDTFKGDALMCRSKKDFSREISKLKKDKKYYKKWQDKSRIIAEKYDSKNAAEDLVKLYRDLLK